MTDNHPSRCHSFREDDALGTRDATAAARLLARKELKPGELVAAAIARARAMDPALAGLAETDYQRAIVTASNRSISDGEESCFWSIPIVIKDNLWVDGLRTTAGSRAVQPIAAPADDPIVALMKQLGTIIIGKTKMPEFGLNGSTEFTVGEPVHNPWHREYSAGGSSGGSAALVAAGVVPLGHGNDGGGSIRIPAACCSLYGLKPTRGRLPFNRNSGLLPIKIVADGILSRSVRDQAAFFAEAEKRFQAGHLPPVGHVQGPAKQRYRIGLVRESFNGSPVCRDTLTALETAAKFLEELGHDVRDIPQPKFPNLAQDFSIYWGMIAQMAVAFGGRLGESFDRRSLEPLTLGLARMFRRNLHRLPMALHRLRHSEQLWSAQLGDCDMWLTPILTQPAPKLGHLNPGLAFDELFSRLSEFVGFTPLNNANGSPAMAIPMSLSPQGLPLGVQLMAGHGREASLLAVAYELEEAAPAPMLYAS